jgi:putative tryptophan/tyrosine transport system substrate-binding protein
MRRREFMSLLGGATAWPLAARAQQPTMPVVGFLLQRTRKTTAHLVAAFREGLREEGYVEGRNVAIESRFADGQDDRLPALAAELVERRAAVIAAGTGAVQHAKAAAPTSPIVFMTGGDPVKLGWAMSLNRPGGNLTGTTMLATDIEAKRIGLLHELTPGATSIAVLIEASNVGRAAVEQEVLEAARNIGVAVRIAVMAGERDFEVGFADIARSGAGALMIAASLLFNDFRERLAALALQYRIPTIAEHRDYVEAGCLMSYGPRLADAYHQMGIYVGRILKGEKPADLPVVLPSRFELVINLKTAKALGLEVPATLLARTDEVVE